VFNAKCLVLGGSGLEIGVRGSGWRGSKSEQGYLTQKNPPPLGPYSKPLSRALRWSFGEGGFL